ncbi:MAG: glutathione S-transferase family protein [Gammaproteobacteria bacterium]|nr:glutathione S-transferase family protein [Gammaproteobacteria bacterium]
MIFYYAPKTIAVTAHIALEEAGAKYEARRLNFAVTEQRSNNYLKVNPKGRVPALVTDEGIITETPAILVYVAQLFPERKLAPLNNPFQFAKMQEFNCYLCATVHVAHAHRVRGARWADDPAAIEAMKKKVPQNMSDYFRLIEDGMLQTPWVLGANYSVADIYLYSVSQWLEGDGVDINDFPRVAEHARRMQENASVKKVLALYQAPA